VSDDPPKETSSIIPTFTPGHSEKTSARALFKVARKGKKNKKQKKLVSTVATTAFETKIKGGFVKTPQHQ
jgi:hypothetical protein